MAGRTYSEMARQLVLSEKTISVLVSHLLHKTGTTNSIELAQLARREGQNGLVEMPKPTDEDKDHFRSILPPDPRVEVKPMFGNVAAFVNGNMFTGLFGSDVGVKLADADREQLLAEGGGPFGPEERPMGGYVSLPAAWRDQPERNSTWVNRALEHVATLPPKIKKPRKSKS